MRDWGSGLRVWGLGFRVEGLADQVCTWQGFTVPRTQNRWMQRTSAEACLAQERAIQLLASRETASN